MAYLKTSPEKSSSAGSSVSEDLQSRKGISAPAVPALQRVAEEEEPLQGKFETVQREAEEEELQMKQAPVQREAEEEEEPVQGKFVAQRQAAEEEEEEPMQAKAVAQREAAEEEEPIQAKFAAGATETVQREAAPGGGGLPGGLQAGIQSMSGMDVSDVNVHYNSDKPAQLNALAYAQGNDIHVGAGQEKHLAHEAWHVVQQRQGRVKPTMQMKQGIPVNDDKGLETEADVMGAKAASVGAQLISKNAVQRKAARSAGPATSAPLQMKTPVEEAKWKKENAGIVALAENAGRIADMAFWANFGGEKGVATAENGALAAESSGDAVGGIGEATNKLSGASAKTDDIQKKTGSTLNFADKAAGDVLSAIGGSITAIVKSVKGIMTLIDAGRGRSDKALAAVEATKAFAEAVKAGFEAALNIQKFASGVVSGPMMSALPGLGLAITAADIIISIYQTHSSKGSEEKMAVISGEYKAGLQAAMGGSPEDNTKLFAAEVRGKFFNRQSYLRLKPGLVNEMEAINGRPPGPLREQLEKDFKITYGIAPTVDYGMLYSAIRLYEFGSKMQEINQKRKVKNARAIGTNFLKLGGDIATFFPGTGQIAAAALKGTAVGIEVAQSAAKFIQAQARESGRFGADKNRGKTQKNKEYAVHTRTLYRAIASTVGAPVTSEKEPQLTKAEQMIRATGVYPGSLYGTKYDDPADVKQQAESIFEGMKGGR